MPGAPTPSVSAAASLWRCGAWELSLGRPRIVGILNITPDSFSDGGELDTPAAALRRAEEMAAAGADMLDVGGESTRPGAGEVPAQEQLERVVPVIEALARAVPLPVSIDTRSARVARAAVAAGAAAVNDVSSLGDPTMAEVVRESGAGLVLMHMRGTPETMQSLAIYHDVAEEVGRELRAAYDGALAAGIDEERIVLDPGIGFSKTPQQNLELLGSLARLTALGRPLLVGPSRKSFISEVLGGVPPRERVAGTVGACVAALFRGARIFRVHDVAPVRQALDVAEAIRNAAAESR